MLAPPQISECLLAPDSQRALCGFAKNRPLLDHMKNFTTRKAPCFHATRWLVPDCLAISLPCSIYQAYVLIRASRLLNFGVHPRSCFALSIEMKESWSAVS